MLKKPILSKTKAAAALIVAFLLPAAAALTSASAAAYAPEPGPDTLTFEYVVGEPVAVDFEPTFTAGELVDVTLTGLNGHEQQLASVGAVTSTSVTKAANGEGGVSVIVTLGDSAAGTYIVSAVGQDSGIAQSVALVASAASTGGSSDDLPSTGFDAHTLALWVLGGGLLLGGGAVLVARDVRKMRASEGGV